MQVAETIEPAIEPEAAGVESARRTRAHGRALRHSAQVRLMRRVIPVAAGTAVFAIAGIVFNPFSASLPHVSVGPVSVSGTKVTMENPRLSGFKKGDRGYEVTADSALQDVRKPALIELQAMKGRIATDDKGGFATMEAKGGLFDTTKEALVLHDDILLRTDKGEEARLKSAAVDFKAGAMKSSDAVTVTVPSGTLTADSLSVVENGKVISFVGNVHALFRGQDKTSNKGRDKVPGNGEGARILTSSAEAPEEPR